MDTPMRSTLLPHVHHWTFTIDGMKRSNGAL